MIINENHPTYTTSTDVAEIAKTLKKLDITYFDFTRNYKTGERVWLTNHVASTQRYLEKKYYLCGNTEGAPEKYTQQVVFLDTLPKQYIYDDVLRSHNIYHAIQMINPKGDYCEFFGFGTTKENSQIINTYLTKLDVLKKFCDYFLEQASSVIKLVEKNKVILPFHNKKLDFINSDSFDLKDNLLHSKLLSKRQSECIKLLIAGKTSRQIASTLNLSPRTVEHYLTHIKTKLNCKNKTELIIKLVKIIV